MMKLRIIGIAFLVASLVSCSNEADNESKTSDKHIINFDARITGEYSETKGRNASYQETDTFTIGDQIGVLGYTLPSGSWQGSETSSLMYNSELTKVEKETFRYTPMAVWPSIGKASFFAYYPYSGSVTQGVISPSPISRTGYPSVTVVLGKSSEPIDFMTAQKEVIDFASSNGGAINFTFAHRLAKLHFQSKFICDEKDTHLYINTLKIRNIYNKAVYTFMEAISGQGKWTDHGNEGTVDAVTGATIQMNSSPHAVSEGDEYKDILLPSGNGANVRAYVLMLPQEYPSAELEIGYTIRYIKSDGGCEYSTFGTKTLPIAVNWEMGKVYTYRFEFVFVDILGIDVKVDVLNNNADWVDKDIPTEMGK